MQETMPFDHTGRYVSAECLFFFDGAITGFTQLLCRSWESVT